MRTDGRRQFSGECLRTSDVLGDTSKLQRQEINAKKSPQLRALFQEVALSGKRES